MTRVQSCVAGTRPTRSPARGWLPPRSCTETLTPAPRRHPVLETHQCVGASERVGKRVGEGVGGVGEEVGVNVGFWVGLVDAGEVEGAVDAGAVEGDVDAGDVDGAADGAVELFIELFAVWLTPGMHTEDALR